MAPSRLAGDTPDYDPAPAYTEARTAGERLREGIPVILKLTEMADSDADFAG
jgi:FtsZ-interacting cell division protein YlmF